MLASSSAPTSVWLDNASEVSMSSRLVSSFGCWVDQNSTSCDTAALDNARQTILADRYRDLVQQDFQHVVRQCLRGRGSPRRIAAETRVLCQELLTGDYSATDTCVRRGMDPVTHGAAIDELIKKVRSLTDQFPPGVGLRRCHWRISGS
jgi:hypothetical protein